MTRAHPHGRVSINPRTDPRRCRAAPETASACASCPTGSFRGRLAIASPRFLWRRLGVTMRARKDRTCQGRLSDVRSRHRMPLIFDLMLQLDDPGRDPLRRSSPGQAESRPSAPLQRHRRNHDRDHDHGASPASAARSRRRSAAAGM